MATPVLAQSGNESLQPIDERYLQIKDGFIEVCMTEEMPPSLSGVRISDSVRTNYCDCWFDYVSSNFSFEEYLDIGRAYAGGLLSILTLDAQTLTTLQTGFEGCYEYAIQADSSVEQDNVLAEDIEVLEPQVVSLRNQGRFEEATLIAEQVVKKNA